MSTLRGIAAARISQISSALSERKIPDQELSGEVIALPTRPRFPIWQSVVLGKCSSVDSYYRRLLREAGRSFDNWTQELLRRESFPCMGRWAQCNLALVSAHDLGFSAGARYREICAQAEALGLMLCPAEVGPALRLQYAGREQLEWVGIGMRPIAGWNSERFIFALTFRNHELLLCGFYSHPDYFWDAEHQFLFVVKE